MCIYTKETGSFVCSLESLVVDCSLYLTAMFVPPWLVVALALTQMLHLSSQQEYGSFSFVENRDDSTMGSGIIQLSESADGDDSNSEKGFKMSAPGPQDLPVECTNNTLKVELPAGPLDAIRILGRLLRPKAV